MRLSWPLIVGVLQWKLHLWQVINTVNYTWISDGSLGTGDSVTHTYNAGTYFPILDSRPTRLNFSWSFPCFKEDTIICPGENVLLQANGDKYIIGQ